MTLMEPYDVYRAYLSLKLHFTTDQYDVIQQKGRVKASKRSFFKRNDLFAIRKIAQEYSDKEVVDFLVANFVSGDRWGGVFDIEAKQRYVQWKKRMESITYTFEKELDKILFEAEKKNVSFESMFESNGQHPEILRKYLGGEVSVETLVILNRLNNFTEDLDNKLSGDIMWPDISRIIKKYTPFLNINKEKYDELIRRRLGHNKR